MRIVGNAKEDEIIPPREVRVGGIFEVPWQGFHTEALIGTMRFMQDMRGGEGAVAARAKEWVVEGIRVELGISANLAWRRSFAKVWDEPPLWPWCAALSA